MDWKVFCLVLAVNSAFCLLQFLAERIDMAQSKIMARHSIIPGTSQKFLYWEDFYMQTYGDFLGLVWVMNGFAQLVVAGKIDWTMWLIFILFTILGIYFTLKVCLTKNHKPDWGYPSAGKVSLGGITHLPYFGIQLAMGIICLIKAIAGELTGVALVTTIAGGMIIAAMAIMDYKTGHFDPLVENETDQ